MNIERFFVPGLAHASYLVASAGEAIVIDPERKVDDYLDFLARNHLQLKGTPLTILCGSGYRSSIATSLLESEGFERLNNVMGGLHAVRHAKRPRLPAVELAENVLTWEI
jgi:rhodanese-related sulfurtransferase